MIDVGIALLIGIVALAAGYFGYAGKFKGLAMVLGGILVLGALFYPGYGYWGDVFEVPDEVDPAWGTRATLDATMANGTWATGTLPSTVSSDGQTITVQLALNTTANNFTTTTLASGSVNFTFSPLTVAGAQSTDLITVRYTIDDDVRYSGNYVFARSAGDFVCNWYKDSTASTTSTSTGQHTMAFTATETVQLRYTLSTGTDSFGSALQNVGDSFTVPVTLSTTGYSETFYITYIVISTTT